jgi:sulfide:quinone oxidoreductase
LARRIGIVGAGDAGTLTANFLASKLKSEISRGKVSIDLFGKHEAHTFQPGNLDVAFRGVSPENFVKEESKLLREDIKFRVEGVKLVSPGNRSVTLNNGEISSYDYLILATGSETVPESIEGLKEGALFFHKGPFDSRRIWEALQSFKGGKVVIMIGGLPHKCPPSPNEAAFLVDECLRKRGIREKSEIRFLTPYPRAYPALEIAKTVQGLFDQKGIDVVPFFNLDFVSPGDKTVHSLEGESFDYDLLLAVPPHAGAKVIRDSGIGSPIDGWIPTNKEKLNVKSYDDVYALGDATDIPISKSGVVAHLESVLLSNNLAAEISGISEDLELYNGRINCPMEVGGRRAIFVSATYTSPPKPQTPSLTKYVMKKGFGMLYWRAMKGSWEPLFKLYFGKTSEKESQKKVAEAQPVIPQVAASAS